MQVTKTVDLGNGHKIEIGKSTWDENSVSVRNRYPTATGGFNVRGSSELPIYDIEEIVYVLADENLLPPNKLVDLIDALFESLKRQMKSTETI